MPHRPKWDADRALYLEYSGFDELDEKFRKMIDGREQ